MEKTQREFLLRRQLDAIRKELGELGRRRRGRPRRLPSQVAERDLPEHVRTAVEREVDKLERTSDQSPETGWIRTWLDTVFELPWGVESEDRLDVAEAPRILDADHDGLDDVKERILEHLAVRKLQAERGLAPVDGRGSGAILALVGPPGVGKTSLGESVASALGRKFVRVALGGVRDEAEIRGHRRTYVGAQPGRLVRALREAGTMNPVIVLDEVDKLGADFRGDPSSALLEVLDPAQNHTFRDHYLEVDLDLSRVLFIATANVIDTIPGPLLDRMEVIRLDGYTENEKVSIARHHLLGRQLERAALRERRGRRSPTRPCAPSWPTTPGRPGVRSSSASSVGCCARWRPSWPRASARRRSPSTPATCASGSVGPLLLRGGRPHQRARRGHRPGRHRRGWRRPLRRGQRVRRSRGPDPDRSAGRRHEGVGGDRPVLRALARRASSASTRRSFTGKRFHLHVPAGAVPKDGPSAGVTMTTALVSLLRDVPVRSVVGMTGEVTLQGRVLPDRRRQAEGAGRPPGRADRGRAPGAQRARPRGRAPRRSATS